MLTNHVLDAKNVRIAVIGLGYVGLPLAVEFGKKLKTIGFDNNKERVTNLLNKKDTTKEVSKKQLLSSKKLEITHDSKKISNANVFIITVPTPIKKNKKPNLIPLINATKTVSKFLKKGSVVILESTVYPGTTEEICVPILEKFSKLKYKKDFSCGYSPERINPGDKIRTLTKIKKVVAGSDYKTTKFLLKLYNKIIKAGVYEAESISVAEMAKVIENSQRDINVAFMNEIALICNKLNINTKSVLDAAKTKWNFLDFEPGLVGGHCISVDPYYLYYKSKKLGYEPQVILSGRKVNDNMSNVIVEKISKKLKKNKLSKNSKVLILGLTFKENCSDVRNSQSIKIFKKLEKKNFNVSAFDSYADKKILKKEFNINLIKYPKKNYYDVVVITVKHKMFYKLGYKKISKFCNNDGFLYDIKNMFSKSNISMSL